MSYKFPDCESCAFADISSVICEGCEDADQWEPADPEQSLTIYESVRVVKIKKRKRFEDETYVRKAA